MHEKEMLQNDGVCQPVYNITFIPCPSAFYCTKATRIAMKDSQTWWSAFMSLHLRALYCDQAACTLRPFSKSRPRAKRYLPEQITLQDTLSFTTDQTFIALPGSASTFPSFRLNRGTPPDTIARLRYMRPFRKTFRNV